MAEKKAKKKAEEKWNPICRIAGVYDYDEELKRYRQSQNTVELQQNSRTKVIRAIVIA
jgi:hypothetical protein